MPNASKLYTVGSESLTLREWSKRHGVPVDTIYHRLRNGWKVADAVSAPVDRRFQPRTKPAQSQVRSCPALKTHRASGRAYCEWQAGGSRHTRYFGKADTPEAQQAYARFQLEWASRLVTKSPIELGAALRVCDLVERWLDYCENGDDGEGGYRKRGELTSTFRTMRGTMKYLASFGTTPIDQFGPGQLRAVRKSMIDARPMRNGAPGKGLTRRTINCYQGYIVQMFGWGVERQLVPATVWHELKAVKRLVKGKSQAKDNPKRTAVPWASVEAVLPHLHVHEPRRALLESLVRVHWYLGGRPQDLVNMRPGELDRSEDVWRYVPDTHKNEHREQELEYWIGPQAQAILAPLLEGKSATDYVFTYPAMGGRKVWRLNRSVYGKRVVEACEKAGVKVWTPHQLRHSRATEVMRIYESNKAAAAVIGDSEEVARTIYVDPLSAVRKRIARETG